MSTPSRTIKMRCSQCQNTFADAGAYLAHRPNVLISCLKPTTTDAWRDDKKATKLLRRTAMLYEYKEKQERLAEIESQMDETL